MKISRLTQSAFTLIEIMIVVAIIGMLATIAIPNYVKARGTAQRTTCISNLQHIDSAVQLWAMENKKDPDQTVVFADISGYLRNTVSCPAGGQAFADSYALTTVEARATCLRKPELHRIP